MNLWIYGLQKVFAWALADFLFAVFSFCSVPVLLDGPRTISIRLIRKFHGIQFHILQFYSRLFSSSLCIFYKPLGNRHGDYSSVWNGFDVLLAYYFVTQIERTMALNAFIIMTPTHNSPPSMVCEQNSSHF